MYFVYICKSDSMMRHFKYKMIFFLQRQMCIERWYSIVQRHVFEEWRFFFLSTSSVVFGVRYQKYTKANRPWFIAFVWIRASPWTDFAVTWNAWFPLDFHAQCHLIFRCFFYLKNGECKGNEPPLIELAFCLSLLHVAFQYFSNHSEF